MMNILIVIDQYYPIGGGIQQYIRGLSQTLTEQDHTITILTKTIEGQPTQEKSPEATIIRTPILEDTLPHPEVMLERWSQLVPIIEDLQPDVVYANNHTSIGSILAAKEASIPAVYCCHGWGLFCPLKIRLLKPDESLCYNERSLENCLRCQDMQQEPVPPQIKGMGRTLIKSIYWRLNWQSIRRQDFAPQVKRYDQFQSILESADARIGDSMLTASMFTTKEHTHGVYYGVNFDEFFTVDSQPFRERYGLDDNPYITLVGRVHPTKGHEWAIRALQYLPQNMKLVLVGATGQHVRDNAHQLGENDYTIQLEQLIDELDLRERVIFTGLLYPEHLRQAYSGAVANLMPSVWLEAFGYVTAEAMACGCPVIATTNSGASELITDGMEGYRIPRMDARAIADAVLQIQPERDKMGSHALATARKRLNWNTIAQQVMTVFRDAIQQ